MGEEVINYKKEAMQLFDKIYEVMGVKQNVDPNNYTMQCKLYTNQPQYVYSPLDYYNPSPYGSFGMDMIYSLQNTFYPNSISNYTNTALIPKLIPTNSTEARYDPSILKGEVSNIFSTTQNTFQTFKKPIKIKERKSSLSST